MDDEQIFKIAVVGFGPKGLYGLERLLAYFNQGSICMPVEIHVYNNTHFFGAGDVYRNDQPKCHIMNYANRNINVWSLDNPKPIIYETPDFVTWLANEGYSNVGLNDFAPRSLVGDYLICCFKALITNLPNNIQVITHLGTVKDVYRSNDAYKLTWRDKEVSSELEIMVQKVLFTTGHTSFKSESLKKVPFGKKVAFIYPTNERLNHIIANSSVALKGIGLTGIDAILALTEARGGIFEEDTMGSMSYKPSGKEPKMIYPFSRTGLPMVPRNGSPNSTTKLYNFTKDVIENLQGNRPINFSKTVLPLIEKEFYFAFYNRLFQNYGQELSLDLHFELIENQVRLFHNHYPNAVVFNWDYIVNPFKDEEVVSNKTFKKYLEFLINEAQLGEDKSPFMAAVSTWRKVSPIFNELYSYGGLDAHSHRQFDSYYFGLFNRLAYGPPTKNMKKLLALSKAGLLDFTFAKSAKIVENGNKGVFQLVTENEAHKVSIDYLVNATIPRAKENDFENELFQNLKQNGLIIEYENKENFTYKPGCLAINEYGNPIDLNGNVNTDFTFYGTPTEGITFDNDTLSRTRNDFASIWAKKVYEEVLVRDRINEKHEREKYIL